MNYRPDFTGAQLIAKVREIAAAEPDFIYKADRPLESCRYLTPEGKGDCIMGRALIALGVPADVLAELEYRRIAFVLSQLGVSYDAAELEWLFQVQAIQDAREPWGRAVEVADGNATVGHQE